LFISQTIPSQWEVYDHPDGLLYFHNKSGGYRYITLANIFDTDVLKEIEGFMVHLEREIHQLNKSLPRDTMEIVLEIISEDEWGYYMIDHAARCHFWLHPFEDDSLFSEVGGLASPTHLSASLSSTTCQVLICLTEHYMEYEYWTHCEWFPHLQKFDKGTIKQLIGMLSYGCIGQQSNLATSSKPYLAFLDAMTSPETTVPYNPDELKQMLSMLKYMQGASNVYHKY
jgi:hypothetical protein